MTRATPSVLWVSAELPDRGLGGGNIRQAHLLSGIAATFPTDLLTIGAVRDPTLRRALRSVVELDPPPPWQPPRGPVTRRARELALALLGRSTFDAIAEKNRCEALSRALPEMLPRGYDVVLVEHATMARLVRHRRGERWALTFQNLESQRSAQRAALAPGRRQRYVWERDAARARRLEAWVRSTYDAVISVSENDARVLGGSTVVPNGVDATRYRVTPLPSEPTIAMTASLNFPPNADGAVWFCQEVLPLVRARCPEVRVTIAGRDPLDEVRALAAHPGVDVVANPPDVLPLLHGSRMAVVPLRVGSGTRLKALEAMACGRPLVGTDTGLEGLGIVDGIHARIADDRDTFAAAVIDVLTSDATASALIGPARALAETFDWEHSVKRLADLVHELAVRPTRSTN